MGLTYGTLKMYTLIYLSVRNSTLYPTEPFSIGIQLSNFLNYRKTERFI